MPIELLFIRDLIADGDTLRTELRGVTDEGSDNVMTIKIIEDDKTYRGLVVAETNEDREKAMLRWGGCKIMIDLTNNEGTIVMSVVSQEDNAATPDPVVPEAPVSQPEQDDSEEIVETPEESPTSSPDPV